MKIEPIKNLRKPAYAVGAAMLTAALLTGCPSDEVLKVRRGSGNGPLVPEGDVPMTIETDVELDGDVAETIETDVELEGEIAETFETDETEEEFMLEGDVAVEDA